MSSRITLAFLPIVFAGLCQAQEPVSPSQANFEAAADLSAANILPAELLQGEHYVVDDVVRNDGYINYYTIRSDYGEFEAASTAMLRIRIREVEALAELDELSKTEVFVKSMAEAGVQQIVSVHKLVTNPVEAIKGLPGGIGRMFNRYSRKTKEAVATGKDYVASQEDTDLTQTEEEKADYTAQAVSLTERYFGVTSAERNWAERLRTDPYTSNEILRNAIKNVARVDSLGKMTMAVGGVSIPYMGIVGKVNEAVWGEDPYALRDRNHAVLVATGADEALIDEYLKSPWMSPTQQTVLTASIASLENVDGRDGILRQALNPREELEVGYFVRAVALLAWYHVKREPFTSVSTELAIPGGITENGKSVMLFPSDHVHWTEEMAEAATEYHSVGRSRSEHVRELWILGTASVRTRQELLALGYELHTDFAEMVRPVAAMPESGE